MSGPSKIEWTQHSWNPVVGCSIVSPGCTNCYAMRQAFRIEAMTAELAHHGKGGAPHYNGTTKKVNGNAVWTGKVALAPNDVLTAPLRRKKPTTYFVNSMGDLFHESVPDEWIDRVFAVMALAPQNIFQVLTKRAELMQKYVSQKVDWSARLGAAFTAINTSGRINAAHAAELHHRMTVGAMRWPLPNVWLGISAEEQRRADERIPHLLATPAAVRFVSAEPLLGAIDFTRIGLSDPEGCGNPLGVYIDALRGHPQHGINKLDWIIVGGESGPGARPMYPDWAREIRDQCATAGVAFFFKQFGSWAPIPARDVLPGRPQMVRAGDLFMLSDGTSDVLDMELSSRLEGSGAVPLRNVGKKAAGRLLDGVEHNAMPGRG